MPENPSGHNRDEDQLSDLRHLLLGSLPRLQERLENPRLRAEDISQILPMAVTLCQAKDKQLDKALKPAVEEAIRLSIKKDPQILANALFPMMRQAIQKSISAMLRGMVQSLNQTLEQSFSIKSLKWRIQAWRTGKPFAEIVLLNTLAYQVEQVFLIHKETGLLLGHVAAESAFVQDGDMVSGMLTAIQDFVRDSFAVATGEALETLQVGKVTVWIEQGPSAILAGVIRGNAPEELRSTFQDALENIHLEQSEDLEAFKGDAAVFETARTHLENCLRVQYKEEDKRTSPLLWVILAGVIIALFSWIFLYLRDNHRWSNYLVRLNEERGIVVAYARKQNGKYLISGFRDPLAVDPQVLLGQARLNPKKVTGYWEPYYSLDPEFILAKAKAILKPPKTASLRLEDGILYAEGHASSSWIGQVRKLVPAIPGITQLKEDSLVDVDLELKGAKERIEKWSLYFVVGTTRTTPGQEKILESLAAEIKELYRLARLAGKTAQIKIIGQTSQEGTRKTNLKLSQERAEKILNALVPQGDFDQSNFTAVGVGSKESLSGRFTPWDKKLNRRVSFEVIIDK